MRFLIDIVVENMIIKNRLGRILCDIHEWEKGFIEVDTENHWKDGYSAKSLAQFFTNDNGVTWLNNIMYDIFGDKIYCENVEIEHESKLDSYGGKHRMQDLAIWGTVLEKDVFVAIEAKVHEPFGDNYVKKEYEKSIQVLKNKTTSKKKNRVEEVVDFFFPKKTPYDEPVCNLRYQLLHYFMASIKEGKTLYESRLPIVKRKEIVSTIVLPVLVFKTKHNYEMNYKDVNKRDYLDFVEQLGFEKKYMEIIV